MSVAYLPPDKDGQLHTTFVPQSDPYQDSQQSGDFKSQESFIEAPTADAGDEGIPVNLPDGNSLTVVVNNPSEVDGPVKTFKPKMTDIYGLPPPEAYNTEAQAVDKIDLAIRAVNEDILRKGKQIAAESKWIQDVKEITETYEAKVDRVDAHINALRHDVKDLYQKKLQMKNLALQRDLGEKLRAARDDLNTLQSALKHVQNHQEDILESKKKISETVDELSSQLAALRGEPAPSPEAHHKANEKVEKAEKAALKAEEEAELQAGLGEEGLEEFL